MADEGTTGPGDDVWVMTVVLEAPIDRAGHLIDIMAGRITTRYLKEFDPDRNKGRGEITFTDDLAEARKFAGMAAVLACWNTQSRVRPRRPDGKPNKPLTGYTITPTKVA